MNPSSATGTMRCQPRVRPTWTAVARIFGSSSHDGARAGGAFENGALARASARRGADDRSDEREHGENAGHDQRGEDAATGLHRKPLVAGNAEEGERRQNGERGEREQDDGGGSDAASGLHRKRDLTP